MISGFFDELKLVLGSYEKNNHQSAIYEQFQRQGGAKLLLPFS
jgi:hypothetical protein